MNEFWSFCLAKFREELSPQQFNTWIKPLHCEIQDQNIRLLCPNRFVLVWVKDKFAARISSMAEQHFHMPYQIDFVIGTVKVESASAAMSVPETEKKPVTKTSSKKPLAKLNDGDGLNPAFMFDNFISGRANQLARATALEIAHRPGESFNPLFIYGGVGLGKTHLIHAIGNYVKNENPEAKIKYLHAEKYVSDLVKAMENRKFDDFKKRYHSLDLILVDDIQFFAKKLRTQEEFFFVFNYLIENKKQIVITCDTYPNEIADMDDRLRTRFSWGLTVSVEPPELEMRVAILLRKAQEAKVKLDEDVAFFVAKQIRSNVRELEGALNRIVAMSNFTGSAIDINLAKDALKDLIAVKSRQITIENIQKTVADYYKIKVAEMYSKKRTRNFARPRQIAMALARELTNYSFPEIGEAFGNRHHTTVMHACDEILSLKNTDHVLARDIAILTQVIRD